MEFSNVVILNKQDLVTEDQLSNILDRISILNPNAKIIKSHQSNINVMEILNTHLYSNVEAMKNQENPLSKTATTKEDLIQGIYNTGRFNSESKHLPQLTVSKVN